MSLLYSFNLEFRFYNFSSNVLKKLIEMVVRTYEEELKFIERINDHSFRIKKGFQVRDSDQKVDLPVIFVFV